MHHLMMVWDAHGRLGLSRRLRNDQQPTKTMLKQLTIQNYVLVEHLDISFNNGLTTITGESGAGKSILLGAASLLLGERARSDTVRPGATKADISAEFALHPKCSSCNKNLSTTN